MPLWFPVRLFVRLDHEPVFHHRLRQPPYLADDRRGLSIQLFFDFCHGLCTFLVLWALGDPWVRKLERIKIKFGLTAEERNYVLPPSTFEIARENYE